MFVFLSPVILMNSEAWNLSFGRFDATTVPEIKAKTKGRALQKVTRALFYL